MLKEYFDCLTYNRRSWKIKHDLLKIVVLTICAVIVDCDVWENIFDCCRVKENCFPESQNMSLKYGIPSHDTIQRVWTMIHPNEFERCFRSWFESVCKKKVK